MAPQEPPELARYRSEVGREPSRLPDEHPDAWQWEYRGTPAERRALLERLALGLDMPPEVLGGIPTVIEGQEEMF